MRYYAFWASLFAFASLLFTGLAVGLTQWIGGVNGDNGIGLWGQTDQNGVFFSWQRILSQNCGDCKETLQWQTAGNSGAAFSILGMVLLLVAAVVQMMKAFKEDLPFPRNQLSSPQNTALFSNLGLYCAACGAISIWFGWALWASLRVYSSSGIAGWSILFIILGFLLAGISAIFFAIEKSGEENAYAMLYDHGHRDLDIDFNVPPYEWTVKSLVNYNSWNARLSLVPCSILECWS